MKNELITQLETFGYPVYLQGSLTDSDPYPDSFFTFLNRSTYADGFYDNDNISYDWEFTIYFYSNNPVLVDTKLRDAINLLKTKGWICPDLGFDVISDEKTHTGRATTVYYKEVN